MQIEDVREHLDYATERLSSQFRAVMWAAIAFVWLAVAGSKEDSQVDFSSQRDGLVMVAIACVIALLLDAVQYFAMHKQAERLLEQIEQEGESEDLGYSRESCMYQLQRWSYNFKHLIGLGSVLALIYFIYRAILG
jgi:membrane protein YqaA with SNARE-associated domain